jgi:molybdate transport system substrate-binding protein
LAAALARPALAQRPLTVFAASSLTDVLQAMGRAWRSQGGAELRFSFASSAVIARQVEAGAPADVVISADLEWMDHLQGRALIRNATRTSLAGNRLVLVAPASSKVRLRLARGAPLGRSLEGGRLALGDPDTVPAGRYARQALIALGLWDQVAGRLAPAENVRTALQFVARGEAPLGVVYATDARIEPRVRLIDAFPTNTHPAIVYPAALTRSAQPGAERFLAFARGSAGQAVFRRFGFTPA